MKESEFNISKFSSHLFWDVDAEKLRMEEDFPFIVKRILEYGLLGDWNLLSNHFSLEEITAVVLKLSKANLIMIETVF